MVKCTTPANTPSQKTRAARRRDPGWLASIATATTSGVSATQANAGWPNLGKLHPSNSPDRIARRMDSYFSLRELGAGDEPSGMEQRRLSAFFRQPVDGLVRFGAIGERSDPDPVVRV